MEDIILNRELVDELVELSTGANAGLLTEILATFERQLPARVTELRACLAAADAAGAERISHSLKSSAGGLGAARVSTIFRDIEHAARDGSVQGSAARLATLDAEMAAFLAELHAYTSPARVAA